MCCRQARLSLRLLYQRLIGNLRLSRHMPALSRQIKITAGCFLARAGCSRVCCCAPTCSACSLCCAAWQRLRSPMTRARWAGRDATPCCRIVRHPTSLASCFGVTIFPASCSLRKTNPLPRTSVHGPTAEGACRPRQLQRRRRSRWQQPLQGVCPPRPAGHHGPRPHQRAAPATPDGGARQGRRQWRRRRQRRRLCPGRRQRAGRRRGQRQGDGNGGRCGGHGSGAGSGGVSRRWLKPGGMAAGEPWPGDRRLLPTCCSWAGVPALLGMPCSPRGGAWLRQRAPSRGAVCPWGAQAGGPTALPAVLPQVQDVLERTAMGGLDWRNCCVYRVTEEGGACVEPEVRGCWGPHGRSSWSACRLGGPRCWEVQAALRGIWSSKALCCQPCSPSSAAARAGLVQGWCLLFLLCRPTCWHLVAPLPPPRTPPHTPPQPPLLTPVPCSRPTLSVAPPPIMRRTSSRMP